MTNLYITADAVGAPTGGGAVTYHESEALKGLGPCEVWGRSFLEQVDVEHERLPDPWKWDLLASSRVQERMIPDNYHGRLKLAHFYAGTFGYTVEALQSCGVKITYTAAAHDVQASRREHELLGIPYNYSHLTEPELLSRYLGGYLAADVLICPSNHSASVMRGFGAQGRIAVIPHGVHLPDQTTPMPSRFTVGYLGAYGPDKGVRYLLEAWKKLNYKDAWLVLAGRDSQSQFVQSLCQHFAPNTNIELMGWLPNVSTFYNYISLYVQPSVTEGFGIEVLEAAAHSRAVLCSTGAGAVDFLGHSEGWKFPPGDAGALADRISFMRACTNLDSIGQSNRKDAEGYSWDKIRARYQEVWKEVLK